MIKQFIKYFLGGLAIVLPLFGLAFLIFFFCTKIFEYCTIESAIILIVPIIIGLIAVGYTRTYFGIKLFTIFESYLLKTPLLGALYKAIKDVTSAFLGAENKFSEPVLVKFAGDLYKIGFITNKDNEYLKKEYKDEGHTLYSVYFPLSFSLSGDLFLVPRDRIEPVNKTAKEAMQMIISGGLIKGMDKINNHSENGVENHDRLKTKSPTI